MAEVTETSDLQKTPEVLTKGQSITLQEGVPVLLGRADGVVGGFRVYRIAGLENNLKVSNFGLKVAFDGQKVVISRPEFMLNGHQYKTLSRITVTDNLGHKVDVEREYDSGIGNSIYRVFVGDKEANNGFILEMVGNNMMRLNAVANKG
jgi:hypothetical protein